jgi:hypothetical protein
LSNFCGGNNTTESKLSGVNDTDESKLCSANDTAESKLSSIIDTTRPAKTTLYQFYKLLKVSKIFKEKIKPNSSKGYTTQGF